jgi:hypothetical protein
MKKLRFWIWALLLALTSKAALASVDGIFWNPAQPGTGWNCSSQNDTMFCLLYAYEGDTVQPTFRSIIANLSYSVLADGDVRVSATGDVYRTTNFTNTVRVGDFSGNYQAGVFNVNAAGFSQSLVPFNFGFPREFDTVTGVYLTSTIPLAGGQGSSTLYAVGDQISITDGIEYKQVTDAGFPVGVMLEFPGIGIAIYEMGFPLPEMADVVFFPSTPFAFGVLQGVESWKGRVGFGCRVEVGTGECQTEIVDVVLTPISNSAGEAQIFGQYLELGASGAAADLATNKEAAGIAQGAVLSRASRTGTVLLETLVKRAAARRNQVSPVE